MKTTPCQLRHQDYIFYLEVDDRDDTKQIQILMIAFNIAITHYHLSCFMSLCAKTNII